MEYVVKNETLKENLSSYGFKFRTVPDKTGKQDFVFLFQNTNELRNAITFYTETRKNLLNK